MPGYAKFAEYQQVRLRLDRPSVSDDPFTFLEHPRAVTAKDIGIIVDVHDVEQPGYTVEFFDADGHTLDVLTVAEDELELSE
jgi:hypothetical protein